MTLLYIVLGWLLSIASTYLIQRQIAKIDPYCPLNVMFIMMFIPIAGFILSLIIWITTLLDEVNFNKFYRGK
jgi:hypothetical protein